MGEQSGVDVVSMRVGDGDLIEIEGVTLRAIHTPGHTDDSYCFLMGDRVLTGDTLLIRGTGRTDFQGGDAVAQYDSIFNKLLTLPQETLVYPGHDYKGDTVSTITEEKAFNPRLQVTSVDEYVAIRDNLNLPNPKMMDVAVPANLKMGLSQDEIEARGWSVACGEAQHMLGRPDIVLVDLRDHAERERKGVISGSVHAPYTDLDGNVRQGGLLHALSVSTERRLVFYCAIWRALGHGGTSGARGRTDGSLPHQGRRRCLGKTASAPRTARWEWRELGRVADAQCRAFISISTRSSPSRTRPSAINRTAKG